MTMASRTADDRPVRLSPDEYELSGARAALARGDVDEAVRTVEPLRLSPDEAVATRAWLLMAHAMHARGDDTGARRALLDITEPEACELMVELARAWALIGDADRAQELYGRLLRRAALGADADAVHLEALVHYRLGELWLDRDVSDACEHWWRAFELNDPTVSPFAAARLVSDAAGDHLAPAALEELCQHAMYSGVEGVAARGALELGKHFATLSLLERARECFETAGRSGEFRDEVDRALLLLDHMERAREELRPLVAMSDLYRLANHFRMQSDPTTKVVLIVGAGLAGTYLLNELKRMRHVYSVCGFVDDAAAGVAHDVEHRVLGGIDELARILRDHRVEEVFMAMPTAPGERRLDVWRACREAGVPLLNLPSRHELELPRERGRMALYRQLREVRPHETFGRRRVEVDWDAFAWVGTQRERVVVVGAGAFGGQIARTVAHGRPEQLTVVDRHRKTLDELIQELRDGSKQREFRTAAPEDGDCMDADFVSAWLRRHRPSLVVNAAGEPDPEAFAADPERTVMNDLAVAHNIAYMAGLHRVARVVHVSSDWAGGRGRFGAMKAAAEAAVLQCARRFPTTTYVIVRSCSLIDAPTSVVSAMWRQVLRDERPSVARDGAVERFLTVGRAAELVLHAARLGESGQVLGFARAEEADLRELAERMLRLHVRRRPDEGARILDTSYRAAPVPSGRVLAAMAELMAVDVALPDAAASAPEVLDGITEAATAGDGRGALRLLDDAVSEGVLRP